uniref:RRM domain-containing protein n=1 Tax=Panagrolaimus davidi TaxID=227884 RepID=A0A914PQG7_9BILA
MMTAVGIPGATPISSYNYYHHLSGAMASNSYFVAAAAHTNGSNASTETTASSLCLTPHAELAIEKMNGQMVGRRAVRTNWAVRRTPEDEKKALSYEQIFNATPIDNTTVYIGNLNSNTTEENVQKSFSRFGEIKEIRMFAPKAVFRRLPDCQNPD